MIENLLTTIIEITISTSFLIILFLLISPILKKKYTAKLQYFIWLIIAIRLLIPINLNLPISNFKVSIPATVETSISQVNGLLGTNLTKANSQTSSKPAIPPFNENTNLETNNNSTIPSTNQNINSQTVTSHLLNITFLKALSFLWIIGVVTFLLYNFIGYYLFKKNLLRWSRPLTNKNTLSVFEKVYVDLNLTKSIKLLKCKIILSPMAIGLFKPIILLPELEIPSDELSIILKHELIHIKRHDISYKLLLTLANSIHWFNPAVYFMVKAANKDLEFYCDEMVVKNMDINYKTKYSEAILSVMHSKTNYNSILSTNFNGGVDTMKKRFKNIFDNKKKRVGILSITFILSLVLCGSSLVACQNSPKSSPEDTAKGFLKGYYEVDNILLLKSVAPYIDEAFGETLLSNRTIEGKLKLASEYNYTLQVTDIKLALTDNKNENKLSYDYSLEVKLTYQQDGTSETQNIDGSVDLINSNDKWLVSYVTETTQVIPNKEYYNPSTAINRGEEAVSSNANTIEPFATSKELCEAYTLAMTNSNFTFIGTYTANALKNTTFEEGQKLWDTIKINSIEIMNSEESVMTKFPNMSKAYYQIKIDVADPGESEFEKGENIRYIYLSSSKKGDVTYWTVESYNNTEKPDELWWDTVNGG